jgi:UPF0755 protein
VARIFKSVYFLVPAGLVVLLLAAAVGILVWANDAVHRPGPLTGEQVVVVPRGAGLKAIAGQLEDAGIVSDQRLFHLYARYRQANRNLRAGEYAFPARTSIVEALQILVEGKAVSRFVTIPEGLTSFEAIALVNQAEGLVGESAVPAEGSILPETYTFSLNEERSALVGRMTQSMTDTLAELWANRARDLPVKTPEEALILASIVEKETGLPEERPRVAAVFANRLRRGMKLQSDPTVAYAITRGKRQMERPLRFKDLELKDPYNTYYARGLPPGPICNPGRAALAAVLNPIETKELYFVADGTGGHVFANTLIEHNRNVEKWRKVQRELRRQQRQQQQQ